MSVPSERVRAVNRAGVRGDGDHVLYWMIAARRPHASFALQHAAETAARLERPLVVLEALRCDYPWASERLHRFILRGMAANRRAFAGTPVRHHAWVERAPGEGRGLLEALAARACCVVTDDTPAFFLPRMVEAAGRRLRVRLEAVDGVGLLPLAAAHRDYPAAVHFRRLLQRELPGRLGEMPRYEPLAGLDLPPASPLPSEVVARWPAAADDLLAAGSAVLRELPLDREVGAVPMEAGWEAAEQALDRFLEDRLERYLDASHPDEDATSGLSPYLHFGHLGAHHAFAAVMDRCGWSPEDLGRRAAGQREGWWGVAAPAEAWLDQLVTWRELGHVTAARLPDPAAWESLPAWARETLEAHAGDEREDLYGLDELSAAATHDPVWNAAQRQLVAEGVIHNHLRMLWGKRVLEWTAHPRQALAVLLELNDRWALDGRDPNSISGITWVLGRYDRPWPERPVFGRVRSMSSARTRRKLRMERYLERFGS